MKPLEAGAIDFLQKPSVDDLDHFTDVLSQKLILASKLVKRSSEPLVKREVPQTYTTGMFDQSKILALGASTGGTEALREVLCALPEDIPATVIVQHIPPYFSKAFADRLNSLCPFEVKEAENGDDLRPGRVLVAPGGKQLRIEKAGAGFKVKITEEEKISGHIPSVDCMYESLIPYAHNVTAAIFTGMGADGAKMMLKLKEAGAHTIGQNQESCVVYGMPKSAAKLGALNEEIHLHQIPAALVKATSKKRLAS